jgi:hypothetical protein
MGMWTPPAPNLKVSRGFATQIMKSGPRLHVHERAVERPFRDARRARDVLWAPPGDVVEDIQDAMLQEQAVVGRRGEADDGEPVEPERFGGAARMREQERDQAAE